MRAKIVIFFTGAMLVVISALVWRSDQLFHNEQVERLSTQIKVQLSTLETLVFAEVNTLDNQVAKYLQSNVIPADATGVLAVSLLGNSRELLQPIYRENSIRTWFPSYFTYAVQTIPKKSWQNVIIVGIVDPQRKPHLIFLKRSSSSGVWSVALLKANFFQAMIDRQKTDSSLSILVTELGQVVAHPTPEYVSSVIKDDPIASTLDQVAQVEQIIPFQEGDQDWIGGFRKITESNLYVISKSNIQLLSGGRSFNVTQLILLAAGISLLVGAVFAWWVGSLPSEEHKGTVVAAIPTSVPSIPAVPTDKEKNEMSTRIAGSIAHELRGPLISVLTQTQFLRGHVDTQGSRALDSIEREMRTGRELIEKLLSYSGEKNITVSPHSLNPLIEQALQSVEGKLSRKGIKVIKNLGADVTSEVDPNLLVRAVSSILNNAIEAMVRVAKKELTIQTSLAEKNVDIIIGDSGEGMSEAIRTKVFDPFFTTKQSSGHVGLGLPMSIGIVRGFGGDIQIQSGPSKGTQVTIRLPQLAHMAVPTPPDQKSEEVTDDLFGKKLEAAIGVIDEIEQPPPPPKMELKINPIEKEKVELEEVPSEKWTSKIDKPPSMDLKKEKPTEAMEVVIRRPGERV